MTTAKRHSLTCLIVFLVAAVPCLAEDSRPISLVVDPAHGGKDRGVQANILSEKTSEAAVSLRFAKSMIEVANANFANRVSVQLTRQDNYTADLAFRAGLAHERQGDLAISIHFAASSDPLKHGIQIYYAPKKGPAANARSGPIEWRRADGSQEYAAESKRLAELICTRIAETSPCRTIEASMDEFVGRQMPSIAMELGYFTNSLDRELLRKVELRKKLISIILQAVIDFGPQPH